MSSIIRKAQRVTDECFLSYVEARTNKENKDRWNPKIIEEISGEVKGDQG